MRCSALQCLTVSLTRQPACAAVCCSVLQCIADRCITLQCVAVHTAPSSRQTRIHLLLSFPHSPLVLPLSVVFFLSHSLAHSHTSLTDKRCLPISTHPPPTNTHSQSEAAQKSMHHFHSTHQHKHIHCTFPPPPLHCDAARPVWHQRMLLPRIS